MSYDMFLAALFTTFCEASALKVNTSNYKTNLKWIVGEKNNNKEDVKTIAINKEFLIGHLC